MPSMEMGPDGHMRPKPSERDRGAGWKAKRLRVIAENTHCYLCGEAVDKKLSGLDPMGPTVDHYVPWSETQDDSVSNLRLAHRVCNLGRGTKDVDEVRYTPQSREW